jgi:hypothetical protein
MSTTHQLEIIYTEDLSRGSSKIPVGIHTNCFLTGIEVSSDFIDINFKDSEGRVNNKRLWAPKGKYPNKDESVAEAITREERENLAHLTKLVHIFLGKEALSKFSGEYLAIATNVAKQLKPKMESKKLNLKLILDKDGVYSEFGRFADYVEESIEGQAPTLFFTKYEEDNRLVKKAKPQGIRSEVNDQALEDILG